MYLNNISDDLRSVYNFSNFTPHLTVFGDVNVHRQKLVSSVKYIFNGFSPVEIRCDGVADSDNYFKSVFVKFKESETLLALYNELNKSFCKYTDFGNKPYDPHISLVYGNTPKNIRQDYIKKISIKKSIKFDKFCLLAPPDSVNGWYDVNNWNMFYEQKI